MVSQTLVSLFLRQREQYKYFQPCGAGASKSHVARVNCALFTTALPSTSSHAPHPTHFPFPPKGGGQEELPHVRGQGQRPRVPDCEGAGTAKRSYPTSEVRGGDKRSYPMSEVSGGAWEKIPHALKPKARGGGQEELPHAPTTEARGGGQEEQPHA